MHIMVRQPPSYLDELSDLPSLYDDQESEEAWFLPDDAAEEAVPTQRPRVGRGDLFDPEAWLAAQGTLSSDLASACLAFGRLDARLASAGEGMRLRLALQEVADLGWFAGSRIGVERLSLFFALRVGAGDDAALLGQFSWGVRRLIGPGMVEGQGGWVSSLATFLGFGGEAVLDLAETMDGTEALHPVTQAAFLFHAWKMAGAERGARDIEGGVLAARLAGEKLGRGALFLPLALASGAGALSRQVMGSTVIGGMLAATGIAIFLIPVTFYVVERLNRRGETAGEGTAKAPAADKEGDGHA